MRQANLVASSGLSRGTVRFGLGDGWILQRFLFRRGLERKPVRWVAFRLI